MRASQNGFLLRKATFFFPSSLAESSDGCDVIARRRRARDTSKSEGASPFRIYVRNILIMDFGLASWLGFVCLFTSFFTAAEIVASHKILITADPPAVELGHPLVVNCSSTCQAKSIIMEGMKDKNPKRHPQWLAHSSPRIQSWSVPAACSVECSSGERETMNKMITVYNQDLNITSPSEVLEINKTYSLECTGPRVYPNNMLMLKWLRGNEIVQYNSTKERGFPDKRLRSVFHFTARTSDDGQMYTCLAEVDLGSNTTLPIINSSVTLQTSHKPGSTIILANNKIISESPVHLGDGDSITLVCDAQGNPKPMLKWEYPKKHNAVINSSAVLHIFNATRENNGIYKCIATNKFGTDEKKVDIRVKDKTVIVAASVSMVATATLATGAVIYYLYRKAQKTQEYKLRNAKPHNNPQVPSE